MESVFGTAIQAEAPAEQTPAEASTQHQEAQQPEAAPNEQQAQPQAPEPTDDPVLKEIRELRARVDQTAPPSEEPTPATDLLSALEGEAATEEGEPTAPAEEPQYEDPDAQRQFEDLRNFIRTEAEEIADARVSPYIERQQTKEISALAQKYPDINSDEVRKPLVSFVEGMVAETGNPGLARNADFIERAYKLVKAEQADSSAVPAEQVATNGASIETNAGSTQTGSASDVDDYKKRVYGSHGGSVFG